MRALSLFGLAIALLAGCAGRPSPVSTPHLGTDLPSTDAPPPYLILSGDLLDLRFFRAPDLSGQHRVRPDGRITLPHVGDVLVEGLSAETLHELIVARYAPVLKDPAVTVSIREYQTPQIYVGGQVLRPGVYGYSKGLTALRAALGAGGFTDQAARSRVVVIRNTGNRTPESFDVDLERAEKAADGAFDPYLQPQDVVIVPRSTVGKAGLFVEQHVDAILPDLVERGFSYALGVLAADEARRLRDEDL